MGQGSTNLMTWWFKTKKSALETNQATRPGGPVYKGGVTRESIKLCFETLDFIIMIFDLRNEFLVKFWYF